MALRKVLPIITQGLPTPKWQNVIKIQTQNICKKIIQVWNEDATLDRSTNILKY